MLALLATLALAQPHWPDRLTLVHASEVARVDPLATLAIAWEESRDDVNPHLRAHYCWHGEFVTNEGLVVGAVHKADCEVGRFQIKPSTAKARCPSINIWTYSGNVRCFLKMFGEDSRRYGVVTAIRIQNGSGVKAKEYTQRVLATIGFLALTSGLERGILNL